MARIGRSRDGLANPFAAGIPDFGNYPIRFLLVVVGSATVVAVLALGCGTSSDRGGKEADRQPKALTEITSLEFNEMPLTGLIDRLERDYAVRIEVESQALPDSSHLMPTFTCSLKNVRLGDGLQKVLAQNNLEFTVTDGVVWIHKREKRK